MSSVAVPFPPDPSPEPIFRLSVQKYHAMVNAGVLTDDDPVELLEGILVFNPRYESREVLGKGQKLNVVLAGTPVVAIPVSDLLP